MKTVTQALGTHLSQETTSLCRLLKITRADGTIFRFTDFDDDLLYNEQVGGPSSNQGFTKFVGSIPSTRAINTVYQNTSTQSLIVMGGCETGNGSMTIKCDSNPAPSTVVLQGLGFGNQWFPFTIIVPPGYYYEIAGTGTCSMQAEVEFLINNGNVGFSGELHASRALGGIYQNTTSKAMLVVANIGSVSGGDVAMYCDATSTPTTIIGDSYMSNGSPYQFPMVMLVPSGYYYKITGPGAVSNWNEYALPFNAVQSADLVGTRTLSTNYTNGANDLWITASGWTTNFGQTSASAAGNPSQVTETLWSSWPGSNFDTVTWGLAQPHDGYSQEVGSPQTLTHWFEYVLDSSNNASTYLCGLVQSDGNAADSGPGAGLTFSAMESKADGSPNNCTMTGFLSDFGISEHDVRAHLYDNATWEMRIVNWNDLTMGDMKPLSGTVGDIEMKNGQFTMELRGWTQKLTTTICSVYQPTCRAELFGGGVEGIDPNNHWKCRLNRYQWVQTGTVLSSPDLITIVPTVAGSPPVVDLFQKGVGYPGTTPAPEGWFDNGVIKFLDGDLAGYQFEIAIFDGATLQLYPQQPLPFSPAPGDTFEIEPGCNKLKATCDTKFHNIINYAGEADIPGVNVIGAVSRPQVPD